MTTQTLAALWQALGGRLPADLRAARRAVWQRPPVVTLVLIVCIAVTFARLQVGAKLPAIRFLTDAYSPRALSQGQLRLLATSTLLTRDTFMLLSICLSLLVALGAYEVLAGHARALLMTAVGAALGPTLVTAVIGVLAASGSTWGAGHLATLDIGASAIISAASGGVAGIARGRLLTAGLVLFLIGGLIVHHRIADWEHLFVFPVGYTAGRRLGRAGTRSRPRRARLVAYSAAGALLLAVSLAACIRLLPAPPAARSASGAALSAARVVDTTYPAPSLGGTRRRVLVLLPAGYDHTRQRFPVVELLHGHPGGPDDLFSLGGLSSILTDPHIAPFIAVIPDGNGPAHADSWFADIPSQQMGTATSTDLRAWVSASYRANRSWSYAGLSSGGFGAAYLPLVDADPVHAVCGLSGDYQAAHLPLPAHESTTTRRAASPIDHLNHAPATTFLAYGRSDPRSRQQSGLYATALRQSHHRVVLASYPGKHQWSVWRAAFRDCLRLVVPAHR